MRFWKKRLRLPRHITMNFRRTSKRLSLIHILEGAVPLPEQEPVFTVYDDIRQKLIAQGMPADQIAFIHEANTEVRKKELFSKVRTGQVRVLLGLSLIHI